MNQHRLDAESALRAIAASLEDEEPSLTARAGVHATLALVHEIAALRERLFPDLPAEVVPPPLSSLTPEAVVAEADYPGDGSTRPLDRLCPVCEAEPGYPCRNASTGGALSYGLHRARFDGVPF